MKLNISIMLILPLLLIISCGQTDKPVNTPAAVNGVLDLRSWDFFKDGPVPLAGEWEFSWDQFLLESDLNNYSETADNEYISVPGVWKGLEINGEKLPGAGYATYRLLILHNQTDSSLALELPTVSTAYTLYINGIKVSSAGRISKDRDSGFPDAFSQIIEFESVDEQLELVFHVSNFNYSKGGLWYSPIIGLEDDVRRIWNINFYLDIFMFGSIFIMGLYHLSIYVLRMKEKASLAFGIFCILISLRIILTGQIFVNFLVPSLPWSLLVRLEFISFYLGFPVYLTFISFLFPEDMSRIYLRIFRWLSGIFLLFVLFSPVSIFTNTVVYFQFLALTGGIYLFYLHIITIIRKRNHSFVLLFGFLVIFLMLVNDILFLNGIIKTKEFFHFGLFIFIFIQAFTLASRFTKSFVSVEQLSVKISTAEEKYRSIFENSTDGIYQSSIDGQFLMVNPAFAHILGYETLEDLLKMSFRENWYVDTEVRRLLVEDLFTNGSIKNVESRVYKKNGEIIEIKENAHVVLDKNGNIQFIEGNITDITEVKQIERLKFEREAAESANKIKSEFLANMSHEIRTPMNAIIGFTELLYIEEENPEKKDKLEMIKTSGKNLLLLINDILDFSKIEAGKTDIENKSFNLAATLDHLYSMFKSKAENKGLDFNISIDNLHPKAVIGDEHRIIQILMNIISNALKFTKEGSITIECNYNDGRTVIKVADTGIGIPENKLDHIFSVFSQADSSTERDYGGTGLGLSISRQLAELMNGSLSAVSTEGVGSVFTLDLSLPEEKQDHNSLKVISSSDNELREDENIVKETTAKCRILVAEDNRINQALIKALLEEIDLECDLAENGRVALDRLSKHKYDLLLLDIQMPIMDGLKTIKHIRQDEKLKDLHVIALTANAMTGDAEEYLKAGCDDYLSKPIDRELLKIKVNKVLKQS